MRILNQPTVCAILCGGAALLFSAAAAHAQVFSDDFSGGNPAQTSEYTLANAGRTTQPGQYRIVNNPATSFTSGFTSYFDHTLGTSAGAMLFFDGAGSVGPSGIGPAAAPPNIYFRNGVLLTPGTQYTFSFWGSSGGTQNVPQLNVLIDGFGVPAANLVTVNGAWTQFSTTYTPTFSGPHTFAIYDVTNIAAGNDGAIDDVRLVGPAAVGPEPSSFALLLPFVSGGAAAVAARLRHRKKS